MATESISPTMDPDPVKQISDECEVCRQEALYYLEGFNGDLDSAMEACRSKTLPPRRPRVSENEESDDSTTNSPMIVDNSPGVSTAEQPLQSPDELINSFCNVVAGADPELAIAFLNRCNWNVQAAIGLFFDESSRSSGGMYQPVRENPVDWQPFLPQYRGPMIGRSSSPSPLQFQDSSIPMDVDTTTTEKSVDEAGQELFSVPVMETCQVNFQNIQESRLEVREDSRFPPMKTWIDRICDENNVSREEALYYLEGFDWDFDVAMQACRRKTLAPMKATSSSGVSAREESAGAPPNMPEPPSQLHSELISSFCEKAAGATREEAIDYLQLCNRDVEQAVQVFMAGVPIEDLSISQDLSLMENKDLPDSQSQFQASPGSQNKGYLKEGEIRTSSSSINADPPETGMSLKEAGEENLTLATPGMESSQEEGKAVKEDSSMGTLPDPFDIQDRIIVGPRAAATTITISILLADGEMVEIPFRSNQTVRDIRDAIDELRPDGDRGYHLQSQTAVECRDLDMTVQRIFPGGATEFCMLLQLLPDP